MKVHAGTIEEFLAAIPGKAAVLQAVDRLIRDTLPNANREILKTYSISLLSYQREGTPVAAWLPKKISSWISAVKEIGSPWGIFMPNTSGRRITARLAPVSENCLMSPRMIYAR